MTRSIQVYKGIKQIVAFLKPCVSSWDLFPHQVFVDYMPIGNEIFGRTDQLVADGISSLTETIQSIQAIELPVSSIAEELENILLHEDLIGEMTQSALKEALDLVCALDGYALFAPCAEHSFGCDVTINHRAPKYPSWPEYPFEE